MASEDLYVFPAWLEQVVEGNVNVLTDTLEMVLFNSSLMEFFDPDSPPTTVDDLNESDFMTDPVELDEKTVARGRLFAGDVFWPSVNTPNVRIYGGLVYWNTGPDPTDKMLVSLHRRRADSTLVAFGLSGPIALSDGPKLWRWSPDGVLSI